MTAILSSSPGSWRAIAKRRDAGSTRPDYLRLAGETAGQLSANMIGICQGLTLLSTLPDARARPA
ncbi:MAG: hypothetical protein U1F68_00210 [Gammaproteobacteria bacterium]